jgi:hypothetical protein
MSCFIDQRQIQIQGKLIHARRQKPLPVSHCGYFFNFVSNFLNHKNIILKHNETRQHIQNGTN